MASRIPTLASTKKDREDGEREVTEPSEKSAVDEKQAIGSRGRERRLTSHQNGTIERSLEPNITLLLLILLLTEA